MRRFCLAVLAIFFGTMAWAQTFPVKGSVTDSSGAPLQNVSVKAYQAGQLTDQLIAETLTDQRGAFQFSLSPGEFRIEVSTQDFAPQAETVEVRPGMPPLGLTLQIAPLEQALEVREDPYAISIEPEQNLMGLVLDEEDLRDLPDDEEDLAEVLREMAGLGGDEEAEFIVDGFSGGRLPPKDQIQQVRINRSPFSAEYSRPGRGRIEIITRAGTGQLRGNLSFSLRDDALNARRVFADTKPPYQRRSFRANVGGPLLANRLSGSLALLRSDEEESEAIRAVTLDGHLSGAVLRPAHRWRAEGRLQYRLLENHTLNFGGGSSSNRRENQGVGETTLPERAFLSDSDDFSFQLRETAILSSSAINEARFQFRRGTSQSRPLTVAPAINVLDAFQSGGAPVRNQQTEHTYEFGDALSVSWKNLSMKAGLQLEYQTQETLSQDNFAGTFIFSSLEDFRQGRPATYTVRRGDPDLDLNQLELGVFLQNDWKVHSKLMLSFGLRYEAQTHIGDKNNFDPRLGFAYSLDRNTVIRGGAGLFHQRLDAGTVLSLLRLDGTRQTQVVIRNPSYPDPFAGGATGEVILPASVRAAAGNLALPYTLNSSLSLERRFPNGLSLALSYDVVRGVHLYRSRNINAPLPGQTERPDPARGNVEQLESSAGSTSHALRIRANQRIGRTTLMVNYSLSSSYDDTNGPFGLPADNYNLRSEWGRASQNQRHSFFSAVNLRLPWNLAANVRWQASSGSPFNITTGFDDNFDTVVNDRPAGVSRNSSQGNGLFNFDLNFSKTISLRSNGRVPASGGVGPDFFQRGGPGPGMQGGGAGPGGPGGFNRRRSGPEIAFFANIRNLLNQTNFTRYSGVLSSPLFGQPMAARNSREVELGVRLNF